jgi:hypothetical protein
MVQRGVRLSMCKRNLHYAACRALKQETAQGPLASRSELWVEQRVGIEKDATGGKVTKEPERTIARKRAMRQASSSVKASGEVRPVEETKVPFPPVSIHICICIDPCL